MISELSFGFILQLLSTTVEGFLTCGSSTYMTTCYGDGAYCCGLNNEECCYDTDFVYSSWWFWFIWFLVVMFIICCSICVCIRRRRRFANRPRYFVIDSAQGTYGAVAAQPYGYPVASTGYQYTAAPQAVPPTAPAYQEKPPDYNTVFAS